MDAELWKYIAGLRLALAVGGLVVASGCFINHIVVVVVVVGFRRALLLPVLRSNRAK